MCKILFHTPFLCLCCKKQSGNRLRRAAQIPKKGMIDFYGTAEIIAKWGLFGERWQELIEIPKQQKIYDGSLFSGVLMKSIKCFC